MSSNSDKLTRENSTTITVTHGVAATVRSYMRRNKLHSMSEAIAVKFADEKLNENSFGLWGRNKKGSWKDNE